jgi:hypothetical protein
MLAQMVTRLTFIQDVSSSKLNQDPTVFSEIFRWYFKVFQEKCRDSTLTAAVNKTSLYNMRLKHNTSTWSPSYFQFS